MFNFIKSFRAEESGAVTVDWVVLCAAVCGLCIAVVATLQTGLDTAASGVATAVQSQATAAAN